MEIINKNGGKKNNRKRKINEKIEKIWRSKEFQMTMDVLKWMTFIFVIVLILLMISYVEQPEANLCLLCQEHTGAQCTIAPWYTAPH